MDFLWKLLERIEYLESSINELDRRQNNMFREATVKEVLPDEGLAVVDANGIETSKVPWLERAGKIRSWQPPSVGERVVLFSPTGEPGLGMVMPGGFSDEFPAPHNKGGEYMQVIGGATIKQTGDAVEITVNGVTVKISGAGLEVTGGKVKHNDHDIGDTHKHTEVEPGGGLSGPPA